MNNPRQRRGWLGTLGLTCVLSSALLVVSLPALEAPPVLASTPTPTCGESGTPAVTAVHGPHMYIDTSSQLNSSYIGYTVRAGSVPRSGLWIQLDTFAGGVVALGTNESSRQPIPDISANQSSTQYYLVTANGPTTTTQTHRVNVYQGDPTSGGTLLCQQSSSILTVSETIKALANKVRSIQADGISAQAEIGDAITVTVTGDTGTLGAGPPNDPGVLSITPIAQSTFPAAAWRLERSEITLKPTGVESTPTTFVNRLYLPGSSGPDRPYVAKYTFRAVGSSAGTARVAPIQYIASGTQVKHTDIGGLPLGNLPTVSAQANLTLTKSADSSLILKSGTLNDAQRTVTYTITVTNTGDGVGALDKILDDLPSGATYVAGSTRINGSTSSDPNVVAGDLVWPGPIRVPPFDSLVVEYRLLLPDSAGTYVNTATGHIGNAVIDGSANVNDSSPARVSVQILATAGSLTANNDSATTPANAQVSINVLANDTSTFGTPRLVTVGSPSNGSAIMTSTTSALYTPNAGFSGNDTFTYSITDGATTASATVTVKVTPQAFKDTYFGSASFTSPSVLANDSCTRCSVTTQNLTTSPLAGSLSLASTGIFTWTANNQNASGSFSFTYVATDSTGSTTSATVEVYVGRATPDFYSIAHNTATVLNVSSNDCSNCSFLSRDSGPSQGTFNDTTKSYTPNSNYWGADTFVYKTQGNTTAPVYLLIAPPSRTVQTDLNTVITGTLATASAVTPSTYSCSGCTFAILTPPGAGTFSLASGGAYTFTPAANGTFVVTYRVTDPQTGLAVQATLTIKVGPRAVNDRFSMFTTTSASTFDLVSNDSCAATCTATKLTDPSFGTATVNPNGTVSFSPNGEIGTATFTYRIESNTSAGITADGTVTIVVDGALDDTAYTTVAQFVDIPVLANDPCNGCTLASVGTPPIGTAVTAGTQVRYTPPDGFSGRVQFPYTVSKNGRSTLGIITVFVDPRAVDDEAITTAGQSVTFDVTLNDVCARCSVTSLGAPSAGSTTVSGNRVTYSPGGYTSSSSSDRATFTYTIANTYGRTSTATVSVYVGAPPVVADDTREVSATSVLTFDPRTNDGCTTCNVEKASEPTRGGASVLTNNNIRFTPAPGSSGQVTMTYLSIDPITNLSSIANVTISVLPVAVDDTVRTAIGASTSSTVTTNDSCTTCTLTIVTGPASGTATVMGNRIDYTPAAGVSGSATVVYRVTDTSINRSADATLTILIDNATPDHTSTPYTTAVSIDDVIANDSCNNCVLKSLSRLNGINNGAITKKQQGGRDRGVIFTPQSGSWGVVDYSYVAGEQVSGQSVGDSLSRTFEIRPQNVSTDVSSTVTILVGPPAVFVEATGGMPINGNLVAGTPSTTSAVPATGCDSGRCTFSLITPTPEGDITVDTDGSYQYLAPLGFTGSDTFTYLVTDTQTSATRSGTVTFNVTAGFGAIAAVKTAGAIAAGANNVVDAGDNVDYTITVSNTGTVTLSDFTVEDPLLPNLTCTPSLTTPLAPQQSLSCTGTYSITQADIDAGSILNTVNVSGKVAGDLVATSASTSVTVPRVVLIDLVKSTSATSISAGTPIPYSFAITNQGNTTLSNIALTDPKITSAVVCSPSLALPLAPGGSISCTGSRLADSTDASQGVTNTATVSAQSGGITTSDTSSVTLTSQGTASIALSKTAGTIDTSVAGSVNGRVDPGDTIVYTLTVTNSGTTQLTNVTVTDPKVACNSATISAVTLAAGASTSCTGTYVITQADIDAGFVENTASATGSSPSGAISTTATRTVALGQVNSLQLSKTSIQSTLPAAGATVTYTLNVTNSGNTTLNSVTVSDPKITCSSPISNVTLAPGASASCTGNYTVTTADAEAGVLVNTATAGGTTAGTNTSVSATASHSLYPPVVRSVLLDKQVSAVVKTVAGDPNILDVGDRIDYTFRITNNGNVNLTNFSLVDPLVGSISCSPTVSGLTLAPSGIVDCTASYTITQTDLNAGVVRNTATVSASASGETVTVTDTASQPLDRVLAITVSKTTSATELPAVGATVPYTLTVTNSSNVPLTSIDVSDSLASPQCTPSLNGYVLPIGGTLTCTVDYVVTQADHTRGSLTNMATVSASVSGADPSHQATVTDTDSITLVAAGVASATIDKVAVVVANATGSATSIEVGDRIDYTITFTNTGTVSLSAITITDPTVGTLSCSPTVSGLVLARNGTVTCTGSLTLTSAHIAAEQVGNTASFSASGNGITITGSDTVTTTLALPASLSIVKTANATTMPATNSAVTYTITVTNTGGASLDTITVSDPLIPSLTCSPTVSGLVLAAGQSTSCTGTYTVTQQDAVNRSILNTATVSAQTVTSDQPVTATDTFTLYEAAAPQISLIKTAGTPDQTVVAPSSRIDAGDRIAYSFRIDNTGNVDLSGLNLTDPKVPSVSCVDAGSQSVSLSATLASGSYRICSGVYTFSQADIDAGSVTNTAQVSGTFGDTTVTNSATATVNITRNPSVLITKTSTASVLPTVGATVPYTITATNDGTVTLTSLSLTDSLATSYSSFGCVIGSNAVDLGSTSLSPGQAVVCTGTYLVTQADVDAGGVTNSATIDATSPSGSTVSASTSLTLTGTGAASLGLTKTATVLANVTRSATVVEPGDKIRYTITATNTGTLTLNGVTIGDPMLASLSCSQPTNLGPGSTLVCTGDVVLTQDDIQRGTLLNTATASATTPSGATAQASTTVTTGITQVTTISLNKSASVNTLPSAGSSIDYSITATNTGNVEFDDLAIVDPLISSLSCTSAGSPVTGGFVFVPGAIVTCTGSYTVTANDVSAGVLTNTASVSARIALPNNAGSSQPRGSTFVTVNEDPAPNITPPPPPANPSPDPDEPSPDEPSGDPGSVSGVIWIDIDRNGKQEVNEPPLPGVVVTLSIRNVRPAAIEAQEFTVYGTTITDPSGRYEFIGVPSGEYRLRATFPTDIDGLEKTYDSDGDVDWVVDITVVAGEQTMVEQAAMGRRSIIGLAYDRRTGRIMVNPKITVVWEGFDRQFDTDDDVFFHTTGDATSFFGITGMQTGRFTCQSTDAVSGFSNNKVSFELTMESADPTMVYCPLALPVTGGDSSGLPGVALVLFSLGLVALAASRRRPRISPTL